MLTRFQGNEIWCHDSYENVKSEKCEDSTGKKGEQPYHGRWGSGEHISTSVQWNPCVERSPTNANAGKASAIILRAHQRTHVGENRIPVLNVGKAF